MNCPVCRTDTLKPMQHEGVTLDFCSGCKGIWFDEGEAAFYVETTEDVPDFDKRIAGGAPVDKACPRCATDLVEFPYVPGEALELDGCGGCRGVFVDGGELPKLEALARKLQAQGKVQRTVQALEKMGYMVLGGQRTR